jgi:hypothetical protein
MCSPEKNGLTPYMGYRNLVPGWQDSSTLCYAGSSYSRRIRLETILPRATQFTNRREDLTFFQDLQSVSKPWSIVRLVTGDKLLLSIQ